MGTAQDITAKAFTEAGLTLGPDIGNLVEVAQNGILGLQNPQWTGVAAALLSAKMTERTASSLKVATWVLAGATVVLALATIGLIAATLNSG
jgi:hypothetical protein